MLIRRHRFYDTTTDTEMHPTAIASAMIMMKCIRVIRFSFWTVHSRLLMHVPIFTEAFVSVAVQAWFIDSVSGTWFIIYWINIECFPYNYLNIINKYNLSIWRFDALYFWGVSFCFASIAKIKIEICILIHVPSGTLCAFWSYHLSLVVHWLEFWKKFF